MTYANKSTFLKEKTPDRSERVRRGAFVGQSDYPEKKEDLLHLRQFVIA